MQTVSNEISSDILRSGIFSWSGYYIHEIPICLNGTSCFSKIFKLGKSLRWKATVRLLLIGTLRFVPILAHISRSFISAGLCPLLGGLEDDPSHLTPLLHSLEHRLYLLILIPRPSPELFRTIPSIYILRHTILAVVTLIEQTWLLDLWAKYSHDLQ